MSESIADARMLNNFVGNSVSDEYDVDSKEAFFVPYWALYLVKRKIMGEEVVRMLNGYILVELAKEKIDTTLIVEDKINSQAGYVRYISEPNLEYRDKTYYDDMAVRKDDYVILRNPFGKKLENNLHAIFDDGKDYVVTQRSKLVAVIRVKEKNFQKNLHTGA